MLSELNDIVKGHVRANNLGTVLFAPVDVFLNEYNAPQPDLVFVSKARESLITNDGIMGAPDLVVEITSPSSLRRDRFDKMRIFKRFALPEVWLIDPANRSVEVYTLAETEYDLFSFAAETGEVTSKALPELKVDVAGLFLQVGLNRVKDRRTVQTKSYFITSLYTRTNSTSIRCGKTESSTPCCPPQLPPTAMLSSRCWGLS